MMLPIPSRTKNGNASWAVKTMSFPQRVTPLPQTQSTPQGTAYQ